MQVEASTENNCLSCKSPNSTNARFCNACGAVLKESTPPPQISPSPKARKICSGCNKINDAAARFCLRCGAKLPATASVPAFGEPAGFWIRALALLLDGVALYVLDWLAEERLGIPHSALRDAPLTADTLLHDLPGMLLSFVIGLAFYTVMVGAWGATLGKMICGIRIIRGDGGRVTYGLSFTRYFAEFLSAVVFGLGYLWVVLSPSKRAWHDYLCDTRVVYKRLR